MPGEPIYYAIDNCDFRNDTPDGKDEFHSTISTVFQHRFSENHRNTLIIERDSAIPCSFKHNTLPTYEIIRAPDLPVLNFNSYFEMISVNTMTYYREWDTAWTLAKLYNNSEISIMT